MLRSIFVCLTTMALAVSALGEEAEHETALGKEIRIPSNLGFATNISDSGHAATVIFDNLLVELSPAREGARSMHNQTAVQTKVATLHIPYKTDQRSVAMTMDLRGFVDTDSAASARLIACVGDKTAVVDLSVDKDETVELKGQSKKAITQEQPDAQFNDFEDRVKFTVQTRAAKPVLQVTLFLLVEHDTDTADSGGAHLVVDSLDFEIASTEKAGYKK